MTENGEAGGEELLTLEECGILAQSHRPLLKLFKIVSIQVQGNGAGQSDNEGRVNTQRKEEKGASVE